MLGLALGGGGSKGIAHIGILKSFKEAGFSPDCIAGTSAGALIGALYAYGLEIDVIAKEVEHLKPTSFSAFRMSQLGLFENTSLISCIQRVLSADALIEEAKIPLAIQVTNIETGIGHILTKGNLLKALLASTCIPGVYIPQEIDGALYVDGGLTANVPVRAAKKLGATVVIGVDLNVYNSYKKPDNIVDVLTNSLDLMIDLRTQEQLAECDAVLSLDLSKYGRLKMDDFANLMLEGEKSGAEFLAARGQIQRLKAKRNLGQLYRKWIPFKA